MPEVEEALEDSHLTYRKFNLVDGRVQLRDRRRGRRRIG